MPPIINPAAIQQVQNKMIKRIIDTIVAGGTIDPAALKQIQDEETGRIIDSVDAQALRDVLCGITLKLDPIQEIQPTGGAIIPLHDGLALRLELKVTVPLSITVDAEGNYIPVLPTPAP